MKEEHSDSEIKMGYLFSPTSQSVVLAQFIRTYD